MKFLLPFLLSLVGCSAQQYLPFYLPPSTPTPTVYVTNQIVIYGATPAGLEAARVAGLMGESAVVVEPSWHVGGMMSGGLGASDLAHGAPYAYVTGDARQLFYDIGLFYSNQPTVSQMFFFEPRAAEATFLRWGTNVNVTIFTNKTLISVTTNGMGIQGINCQDTFTGSNYVFIGRIFVDASYAGDLLPGSGVSYTWGREATNVYGESDNGVRTPNTGGNQFGKIFVDPYKTPGLPSSGLISGVSTDVPVPGTGDNYIMASNMRLCLTSNDTTNAIRITNQPSGYIATNYEILGRYAAALASNGSPYFGLSAIMGSQNEQNGNLDINNKGPVSTDFLGQNQTYLTNTWAGRLAIGSNHLAWIEGIWWYLQTNVNMPYGLKAAATNQYYLTRDNFTSSGGWPDASQLYVREGYRMVGKYVVTEGNCLGTLTVSNPIAQGFYTMDSHNCRRVIVGGAVENEGDVEQGLPGYFNYHVAQQALVPQDGQCTNLIALGPISASHIAFGSHRVEPELVMLAVPAGVMAAYAATNNCAVQQIPYAQILEIATNNFGMVP